MKFSRIRATYRAIGFAVLVGSLLGPYALMLALNPKKRHIIAGLFFKGCLKLTGVRVRVHGWAAYDVRLYAANHASYLDIPVLGAVLSQGVFVAKNEVAAWPLFGFLARISRTIFISRNGTDAQAQRDLLAKRMNRGTRLILFPEGTSSDGARVLAFKTSLFSALQDVEREPWVQPVSIVYARERNGRMLTQAKRNLFTWFADMTLAPHLLNVFGIKGCEVDVIFHAPLSANAFADRKQLAKRCQETVARALESTLNQDCLPGPTPASYPTAETELVLDANGLEMPPPRPEHIVAGNGTNLPL